MTDRIYIKNKTKQKNSIEFSVCDKAKKQKKTPMKQIKAINLYAHTK